MTTKTILVTGAAGNVAGRVVRTLTERGLPVRAMVRASEKVAFPSTVEVAKADFQDAASLAAALHGVGAAYLLSSGPQLTAYEQRFIDEAKRAGVAHVVKHSVQGAEYEASIIPRWHRASEKHLEASGLAWTVLRPASFASNALGWAGSVKASGVVYGALGDAALPVIDPDDIATVAALVLSAPAAHAGKAYTLTGPVALTTAQQVGQLGEALTRGLAYVNVPDEAARDAMRSSGMDAAWVDAMVDLIKTLRGLGTVAPTDTFSSLTGKAPRAFAEWARLNVASFR